MFRSESRELSMDAIYMMVAKETGLNAAALTDKPINMNEVYDPTKKKVTEGSINFKDTDGDKRFDDEKSENSAPEAAE